MEVLPSETGTIETTTSVRPSTRVGSQTLVAEADGITAEAEVRETPLRLRRMGYKTISLQETVLFTNYVQNLTQSTQRDVKIVEQVPQGFKVVRVEEQGVFDRRSGTITWNLAALPPGETAKLSVQLQAESTGELLSHVKGSTRTGKALPILARVRVNRLETNRVPLPQECCRR